MANKKTDAPKALHVIDDCGVSYIGSYNNMDGLTAIVESYANEIAGLDYSDELNFVTEGRIMRFSYRPTPEVLDVTTIPNEE